MSDELLRLVVRPKSPPPSSPASPPEPRAPICTDCTWKERNWFDKSLVVKAKFSSDRDYETCYEQYTINCHADECNYGSRAVTAQIPQECWDANVGKEWMTQRYCECPQTAPPLPPVFYRHPPIIKSTCFPQSSLALRAETCVNSHTHVLVHTVQTLVVMERLVTVLKKSVEVE